jgi:hypothetical protein
VLREAPPDIGSIVSVRELCVRVCRRAASLMFGSVVRMFSYGVVAPVCVCVCRVMSAGCSVDCRASCMEHSTAGDGDAPVAAPGLRCGCM